MSQQKIILVAGPTAAGKSAFALDLAKKNNGLIVNTDAMQIYAGLPILSAQPPPHKSVPHHLYGVLDPAQRSSAGVWLGLARKVLNDCKTSGQTAILVGGTGLYFKALLDGLAAIPAIPDAVRAQTQELYDQLGEPAFRLELAKRDPESAARLAKNDRQRLIRAYEVALHTGKPLTAWHQQAQPVHEFDIEPHLILPDRDALYAACDRRFTQMIDQGAMTEAENFLQRQLPPDLPAMKTLGLREISAYLNGVMTLTQAVTAAQQATRNYAKRQMTWFRNQWKF